MYITIWIRLIIQQLENSNSLSLIMSCSNIALSWVLFVWDTLLMRAHLSQWGTNSLNVKTFSPAPINMNTKFDQTI